MEPSGNVTDRKRTDQKLWESEERLRSLAWHLPIYLTAIDGSGRIQFWNPYAERLLGYTAEEAVGKLTPYMIHGSKEEVDEIIKRASKAGICDKETTFIHKDGKVIPIHMVVVPSRDQHGRVIGFYGFALDITERTRAERALKESESELRVLSSRLLSVQEKEKKRIALELHDSIGQTLQAIRFGVQNVLKQMDHPHARSTTEQLKEITSMIDGAIEETRRITMDLRPSILDDLGICATVSWFCRKFQELCCSIYVERTIKIREEEIPDTLKTVIFRILQEAFNNIAKHSKATRVAISLIKRSQGIELTIKDNGRGCNVKEIPTAKDPVKGFGLASMRERTRLSGGLFSFKSIVGKGTTVSALWTNKLLKEENRRATA